MRLHRVDAKMMRPGQASLQPATILAAVANFQTRALKTIHVARLSPFARTRALLSSCSVLGWQMGLSLRGVLG